MSTIPPPPPPPLPTAVRKSKFSPSPQMELMGKVAVIGTMALLLLIPLGMIRGVLTERLNRRNEAVSEITSTWGSEQMIVGPVLVVPYRYYFKDWKEELVDGKPVKIEFTNSAVDNAYFLPAESKIDGTIDPKALHRGIYDAVVYNGALRLSGTFAKPDFKELKVEEKDVLWDDAVVSFAVPDLRGTREKLQLQMGADSLLLSPGCRIPEFTSGVECKVPGLKDAPATIPYSLDLTLNGSSSIRFAPVGIQNTVSIASKWPDPGFIGSFLPTDRKISADGFKARWDVSYYGRSFPQLWLARQGPPAFNATSVNNSSFGVRFVNVVDSYRAVERSIKYGILFIVLVFTAFFLFELLARLRIHVLQYLLVGFALCLFYLALLSLSEFVDFGASYLTAALASTALITLYCRAVLKSGKRTGVIAAGLLGVYGFLYVILQRQDYSLLFGTIGLFFALSLVMFFTRRLNWETAPDGGKPQDPAGCEARIA